MNYSKPSVSRAIKLLKESDFITLDDKGYIDFTKKGQIIADGVYDRHQTLTQFFIKLGVSMPLAEMDGCRIEHIISEETYQCIKKFMNK